MSRESTEIFIAGNYYSIKSDKPKAEILQVAGYVDRKIKETRQKNTKLNPLQVNHLTMLNMSEEYQELYNRLQDLLNRTREPMKEYPVMKVKIDTLEKELQESNKKYEQLENTNSTLLQDNNEKDQQIIILEKECSEKREFVNSFKHQKIRLESEIRKKQQKINELEKELQELKKYV